MKIETFDKNTCKLIETAVERALKSVAEEHGLSLRMRGGSYNAGSYTAKVEFATVSADGIVNTREVDDFKALARYYGLDADDLGKTFKANGTTYTITGLRSRARKNAIIAKEAGTGKDYCFAAEVVRKMLGKPESKLTRADVEVAPPGGGK